MRNGRAFSLGRAKRIGPPSGHPSWKCIYKRRGSMPHAEAVRDLLAHYAKETFVGRNKELALLARALEQSMPPVSFVHGIGGIGKSRVLEAFTSQARAREAFVVRLDCRQFE